MNEIKLKFKVKFAWWFPVVYLPLVFMISNFIVDYINVDHEPNFDRIEYWLEKALTIEVV